MSQTTTAMVAARPTAINRRATATYGGSSSHPPAKARPTNRLRHQHVTQRRWGHDPHERLWAGKRWAIREGATHTNVYGGTTSAAYGEGAYHTGAYGYGKRFYLLKQQPHHVNPGGSRQRRQPPNRCPVGCMLPSVVVDRGRRMIAIISGWRMIRSAITIGAGAGTRLHHTRQKWCRRKHSCASRLPRIRPTFYRL